MFVYIGIGRPVLQPLWGLFRSKTSASPAFSTGIHICLSYFKKKASQERKNRNMRKTKKQFSKRCGENLNVNVVFLCKAFTTSQKQSTVRNFNKKMMWLKKGTWRRWLPKTLRLRRPTGTEKSSFLCHTHPSCKSCRTLYCHYSSSFCCLIFVHYLFTLCHPTIN